MLTIRPVTYEDAQTLFEWRNDPLTRAMSRNANEIGWDSHVSWLEQRLERENPDIFICEIDGSAVGTFNFDDDEISYTTAPSHRGKGVATKMLIAAREQFGVKTASIHRWNAASIVAATKAGMRVRLIDH
jgi:RimJ/RimL family protein N-acetyltransferase